MFSINDKISIRQLQILLILEIFGAGVIILPRRAAEFAGQDGWMVILIATAFAVVCVAIMSALSGMFPEKSFYEYTAIIAGKPVAFILSLGLVIRFLLNAAFELRLFGEIIKQTMLFHTPFWVICLFLLLISGFAAAKGYETRARLGEVLIFVILVPLVFVFAIGCAGIDFTNVLPVLKASPGNLFRGGFVCLSAFTGIEMLLLSFPYINKTKKIGKSAVLSILVIGLFMTAITFITIARFGPINILRQLWPVLEMMDAIDIPGSFIERQEALIMSFWIVSIFAMVNASLFFSSVIIKSVVKKGKHSMYILLCIGVTLFAALLPDNMDQVYILMDKLYITFGVAYMAVIPAVLLLMAKIRRVGKRKASVVAGFLIIPCLLTGCWDNIEPESRGFVVSLGIDKDSQSQEIVASMELPDLEALTEKNADTGGANKQLAGETLSAALSAVDAYSSKKIYFGHTKVIVLGGELLKDSIQFQRVMDALERNREISRKVLIVAADGEGADIINATDHEDSMVGMFISNFYNKNRNTKTAALRLDLDGLSSALITGGSAIIPAIGLREDGLKMGGAAVIKDFALADWISEEEVQGMGWLIGSQEGAQLSVSYEDTPLPLTVSYAKSKLNFYEKDGQLNLDAFVKVQGSIEEFRFGDQSLYEEAAIERISGLFEIEIANEITQTLELFQKEIGVDGYGFHEYVRKFHNDLYKKRETDWEQAFLDMASNITVDVEIKSIGGLK